MTRRRRLAAPPRLEVLEDRKLLTVLTPSQIDSAYGLNAVTFDNGTIKGNGAGQTIAIIGAYHDAGVWTDLLAFDAKYGIANPYLTPNIPANPPTGTARAAFSMANFAGNTFNASWAFEESLDAEMAHAAAPDANIIMVEAKSPGIFDTLQAIKAVETLPSVSVISISWGGPEFQGQQSLDSSFTTPVGHQGITFVASSGDDGAGAQWPASSPDVVGVGGTSLNVASTGARATESAWSSSGGAVSQVVSKPGYQASVVAGSSRSTPDVSADADPNDGLDIVSQGGVVQVGGTSMAAPLWAGLIAIADQGLALQGKNALDGVSQTLPDLYKAPAGSFYDVKTGSRAEVGYDTSTGLGTPNAPTLIGFLDGKPTSTGVGTPKPTTSTSTPIPGTVVASPSFALANSISTLPSAAIALPWSSPSAFVANLVAVDSSTILQNPEATDAVLEGWDAPSLSPTRKGASAR